MPQTPSSPAAARSGRSTWRPEGFERSRGGRANACSGGLGLSLFPRPVPLSGKLPLFSRLEPRHCRAFPLHRLSLSSRHSEPRTGVGAAGDGVCKTGSPSGELLSSAAAGRTAGRNRQRSVRARQAGPANDPEATSASWSRCHRAVARPPARAPGPAAGPGPAAPQQPGAAATPGPGARGGLVLRSLATPAVGA